MKMLTRLGIYSLFVLCLPAQATLLHFDASADFSATNNPSGTWSYGWSTTLGSNFNLDTANIVASSLNIWQGLPGGDQYGNPTIAFNPTASTVQIGGLNIESNGLSLHPGPTGQYSILRWTAPDTGVVDIDVLFEGRDNINGTTTDVNVLHEITSLYSDFVTDFGPASDVSFQSSIGVNAGDFIDFAIGWGQNGNYLSDSTGITARLALNTSPVPVPPAIWLFGYLDLV